MSEEKLISRQDVADLFHCSLRTIIRFEKQGRLHPVRLSPRVLRYKADEVHALIGSQPTVTQ